MIPYIKDDEVWAVAKLYDEAAISMLQKEQMSTSPGVLIGKDSFKIISDDGKKILVEGEPALLDHICLCKLGVWDKGGGPEGVEQLIEDEARIDAIIERRTRQEVRLNGLMDAVESLSNKVLKFSERSRAFCDARQRR
jgi:hypothetical protein